MFCGFLVVSRSSERIKHSLLTRRHFFFARWTVLELFLNFDFSGLWQELMLYFFLCFYLHSDFIFCLLPAIILFAFNANKNLWVDVFFPLGPNDENPWGKLTNQNSPYSLKTPSGIARSGLVWLYCRWSSGWTQLKPWFIPLNTLNTIKLFAPSPHVLSVLASNTNWKYPFNIKRCWNLLQRWPFPLFFTE